MSRKQQAIVEAAALVEHAKPLNHAVNEAEEHRMVADTLKKFLENHQTKGRRVCIGLPGRMALGRQFDLPPVDAAKRRGSSSSRPKSSSPFRWINWSGTGNSSTTRPPAPSGGRSRPSDFWRRAVLVGRNRPRRGGSWMHFGGSTFVSTCCKRILSPCTTFSLTSILSPPASAHRRGLWRGGRVGYRLRRDESRCCRAAIAVVSQLRRGGQGFTRALVRRVQVESGAGRRLKRQPDRPNG